MSHTQVLTSTHIGRDVPPEMARLRILKKLVDQIEQADSGCWIWTGWKTHLGYGNVTVQGKPWAVHRLTYTIFKGPIPPGMYACHKCDTPACCNPDHLFLGTAKDNSRDSRAKNRHYEATRTHCAKGHPYSGDNLYVDNRGYRHCKTCSRAKCRLDMGWPEDLWFSLAPVPAGFTAVPKEIRVEPRKRISNKDKTHCHRGHPLSGDNLYIVPSSGRRQCKKCRCDAVMRAGERRQQFRDKAPHV